MSKMDFTPADTTVIGVLDSTVRSADSSKVSLAPRCTPPRPPVANTRMPARPASTDPAATVLPQAARGGGRRSRRGGPGRREAREGGAAGGGGPRGARRGRGHAQGGRPPAPARRPQPSHAPPKPPAHP